MEEVKEFWANQYSSTTNSGGVSVITDTNNNVYIASMFQQAFAFGGDTINTSGSSNMFVGKTDSDGNEMWAKTFNNRIEDTAKCIDVDKHNHVFICSNENNNIYVRKLNKSDGETVWEKTFTSGSSNMIKVDMNNDIYISGYYQSDITFGPYTLTKDSTNINAYICKLNTHGDVLWANGYGGNSNGICIAVDRLNKVYLAGKFKSSLTFGTHTVTLANTGTTSNVFVGKLHENGNELWLNAYGNSKDNYQVVVATGKENDLFIAADFRDTMSFGQFNISSTSTNTSDYFIGRLNAVDGKEQLVNSYSSPTSGLTSYPFDMVTDKSNNVFVIGMYSKLNGQTAFIVKVDKNGTLLSNNTYVDSTTTNHIGKSISLDKNDNLYAAGTFEGILTFNVLPPLNSNTSANVSNIFLFKVRIRNEPPVITIMGNNTIYIDYKSSYIDPGATAIDNLDGIVVVTSTGIVDTSMTGSYTITYTAIDTKGNVATAHRLVHVIDFNENTPTKNAYSVNGNVFSMRRNMFIQQQKIDASTTYESAIQKKFYGNSGNRDASSIASRRAVKGSISSYSINGSGVSFQGLSTRSDENRARQQARSGGAVVPPKSRA
jgi:hypothetical protein